MLGPLLMGSAAGAFDLEATRTERETARAQWFEQHGAALLAPLLTPGTNPYAQAMHCVGVAGTGLPAHAALLRQTAAQLPAALAPACLAGAGQLAQGQRLDVAEQARQREALRNLAMADPALQPLVQQAETRAQRDLPSALDGVTSSLRLQQDMMRTQPALAQSLSQSQGVMASACLNAAQYPSAELALRLTALADALAHPQARQTCLELSRLMAGGGRLGADTAQTRIADLQRGVALAQLHTGNGDVMARWTACWQLAQHGRREDVPALRAAQQVPGSATAAAMCALAEATAGAGQPLDGVDALWAQQHLPAARLAQERAGTSAGTATASTTAVAATASSVDAAVPAPDAVLAGPAGRVSANTSPFNQPDLRAGTAYASDEAWLEAVAGPAPSVIGVSTPTSQNFRFEGEVSNGRPAGRGVLRDVRTGRTMEGRLIVVNEGGSWLWTWDSPVLITDHGRPHPQFGPRYIQSVQGTTNAIGSAPSPKAWRQRIDELEGRAEPPAERVGLDPRQVQDCPRPAQVPAGFHPVVQRCTDGQLQGTAEYFSADLSQRLVLVFNRGELLWASVHVDHGQRSWIGSQWSPELRLQGLGHLVVHQALAMERSPEAIVGSRGRHRVYAGPFTDGAPHGEGLCGRTLERCRFEQGQPVGASGWRVQPRLDAAATLADTLDATLSLADGSTLRGAIRQGQPAGAAVWQNATGTVRLIGRFRIDDGRVHVEGAHELVLRTPYPFAEGNVRPAGRYHYHASTPRPIDIAVTLIESMEPSTETLAQMARGDCGVDPKPPPGWAIDWSLCRPGRTVVTAYAPDGRWQLHSLGNRWERLIERDPSARTLHRREWRSPQGFSVEGQPQPLDDTVQVVLHTAEGRVNYRGPLQGLDPHGTGRCDRPANEGGGDEHCEFRAGERVDATHRDRQQRLATERAAAQQRAEAEAALRTQQEALRQLLAQQQAQRAAQQRQAQEAEDRRRREAEQEAERERAEQRHREFIESRLAQQRAASQSRSNWADAFAQGMGRVTSELSQVQAQRQRELDALTRRNQETLAAQQRQREAEARQAQSERERQQREREAEALRRQQEAQQAQQALQRRIAASERAVAEQRSRLQAAASPHAGAPTGASAHGPAGGGDYRESPEGVVICELGDAGRFACTTTLGTRITGGPSEPSGWRTPEEAARHVGGCRQARPISWRAGYAVFGCGTGVTGASNYIDVAARLGVQIPGRQTFWCRPMESGCSRTQRPS